MPIYEYKCASCGHMLEVIQKFNDAPLTECPECGGRLEKLISRSAFQLKGGGWYSEGYGGGGSGSSTASSSSSPTGSKSEGGSSSDATPKGGKKAASGGGCGSGSCGCH